MRALRPVEWYNLASKYGWWQSALHDDFYDEFGHAQQPKIEMDELDTKHAPVLNQVARTPESLLGFSMTKWELNIDLIDAWSSLEPMIASHYLLQKFDENEDPNFHGVLLEISAILGPVASDVVYKSWTLSGNVQSLFSLSKATASCLPHDMGFRWMAQRIKDMEYPIDSRLVLALSCFESEMALEWIEANISTEVHGAWGALAASSHPGWTRLSAWLRVGRPLSLAALDCMVQIARPTYLTLLNKPGRLLDPPNAAKLHAELTSYGTRDNVPRVRKAVSFILQNPTYLVQG